MNKKTIIQFAWLFGLLTFITVVAIITRPTEINRLEQRLKLPKNSLINNFKEKNIPEITIYNQIRGQLLWNKVISYTIANNITISNNQKEEALQNFITNSGEVEYNLSEIFISSNTKSLENFSKKLQPQKFFDPPPPRQ